MKVLISLGAELSLCNTISGGTPLHCLAQSNKRPVINRIECARLLMEAGADPFIEDNYGKKPSDYAEDTDRPEKYLLDSFPHLKPGKSLKAVLIDGMPDYEIFDFIQTGNVDAVKKVLEVEYKDDVSALSRLKNNDGKTLVFFVIYEIFHCLQIDGGDDKPADLNLSLVSKLQQILKILLSDAYKLDPNNVDRDGDTPIHVVCEKIYDVFSNHLSSIDSIPSNVVEPLEEVVIILLQSGAEVSKKTIFLLHDASRRENVPMIKFLIQKVKIDVDFIGRQGLTPLHFAARSGRLEALNCLIDLGANVNVFDDRGKTPLDAAIVNKKTEIISILEAIMDKK